MLVRDLLAGKNKEMFECAVKVFDCENSIIDPLYDSQDAKKPSARVLDMEIFYIDSEDGVIYIGAKNPKNFELPVSNIVLKDLVPGTVLTVDYGEGNIFEECVVFGKNVGFSNGSVAKMDVLQKQIDVGDIRVGLKGKEDGSRITILVKDIEDFTDMTFLCNESVSKQNIVDKMMQAVKNAEVAGYVGWISDIPKKYINEVGLTVIDHDVISISDKKIGKSDLEKAGIYAARCEDCNSLEDGVCTRYGGRISVYETEKDCVHGSGLYKVTDLENNRSRYLKISDDLEEEQIAELLGLCPDCMDIESLDR